MRGRRRAPKGKEGERAVVERFLRLWGERGEEGAEGDAVEVRAGVRGFAVRAGEGFGGWVIVEGGGGEGLG